MSNPYLSQVERGLRKPSAEVLHKIAGALQISAEHLFVQAGLLDESMENLATTPAVINADPALTPRQRRTLVEIYSAFVAQNEGETEPSEPAVAVAAVLDESTPVPVGHANPKE